jgi:hypothetical protein
METKHYILSKFIYLKLSKCIEGAVVTRRALKETPSVSAILNFDVDGKIGWMYEGGLSHKVSLCVCVFTVHPLHGKATLRVNIISRAEKLCSPPEVFTAYRT